MSAAAMYAAASGEDGRLYEVVTHGDPYGEEPDWYTEPKKVRGWVSDRWLERSSDDEEGHEGEFYP